MAPSVKLPSEIQVIESPGGVRYRFPRRRTRRLGIIALLLLTVASAAATGVTESFDDGVLGSMAFAFFLLAAFLLLCAALSRYFGRAEVEVDLSGGEIRAIERVGPFRRSQRIALMRVSRLVVFHQTLRTRDDSKAVQTKEPVLAEIIAEVEGNESVTLAANYPRTWLLALAWDLARRTRASAHDPLADLPPSKIDVVESAVNASGFHEGHERLAGSAVSVERHPDGVTLVVPPRGIGRAPPGASLS